MEERLLTNITEAVVWLFDYDLTLYAPGEGEEESKVLPLLDKRITAYMCQYLNMSAQEADKWRHQWWVDYGTTLRGLQIHHQVDPHHYFDYIHAGEELIYPPYSPAKKKLFEELPGKKYVFTNGRRDWAQKGLESMGIDSYFLDVFDLEYAEWEGKPDQKIYQKIHDNLAQEGKIIFLEDNLENLAPAQKWNWELVWVSEKTEKPEWIDCQISSILELGRCFAAK
jgi:putative hydrolase of the HAD superfamily